MNDFSPSISIWEIISLSRLNIFRIVFIESGNYKTDEIWEWREKFFDTVIKSAKPLEGEVRLEIKLPYEEGSITNRAYCPLCGRDTESIGLGEGWKLPEGLKRHLKGYGNMNQCVIAREALDYGEWEIERIDKV